MTGLVFVLDPVLALRTLAEVDRSDLLAAAALADLAGASALRLSVSEDLSPVRESDVLELRGAARRLELRMPLSQSLLKVVLEARPDRVVLAGEHWNGLGTAPPIDPRNEPQALPGILKSLDEAGLETCMRIAPDIEIVKAAHGVGVGSLEFFTGSLVDLPPVERRAGLVALSDAARLAGKLRVPIALAGGLTEHDVRDVREAAPNADRIVCGRALARRAMLVGIDRALRDFRAQLR